LRFSFGIFSATSVKIFDRFSGVNNFSNFSREVEKYSLIFPMAKLGFNGKIIHVFPLRF
jgi:hypothetical protein